ncbi:MAG: hypothetical protein KDN22_24135 [Verrucomicrobiae bacterium]|nr:hypothetical protein [Verrucomicrobiae bacterium]
MKFPSGEIIRKGEMIWWDEGARIGVVHEVLEEKEELEAWGLEDPHIVLSGSLPYSPDDKGYISYPLSSFVDEGIEMLTAAERIEIDSIMERAFKCALSNPKSLQLVAKVADSRLVGWIAEVLSDGFVVERIEFPNER